MSRPTNSPVAACRRPPCGSAVAQHTLWANDRRLNSLLAQPLQALLAVMIGSTGLWGGHCCAPDISNTCFQNANQSDPLQHETKLEATPEYNLRGGLNYRPRHTEIEHQVASRPYNKHIWAEGASESREHSRSTNTAWRNKTNIGRTSLTWATVQPRLHNAVAAERHARYMLPTLRVLSNTRYLNRMRCKVLQGGSTTHDNVVSM